MNNELRIGLFLFFNLFFVNGQDMSWSLTKCMEIAIENTFEIKIKQLELKRVKKAKNTLLQELLPVVSFTANHSYNFGSTIDPSTNGRVSSNIQNDNFYLNAQMRLVDFESIASTKNAHLAIEIAQAEKEVVENEYKLQILESYFQALYTQELEEIQNEQLANSKENYNRISKEVTLGNKPVSDLYDIELFYYQEEKRRIETKQLLLIQKKELFQLMNYDSIDIKTVKLSKEFFFESIGDEMENTNPRIKIAELNKKKGNFETQRLRGSKLPSLVAFYQVSSFYFKPLNQSTQVVDGFNMQIKNNKNQQVGFQLNIPIFNGFKNDKRVLAAKIEEQRLTLESQQAKYKIAQQIVLETEKMENYIVLQSKLDEILLLAKKAHRTALSKFLIGKIDAYNYTASKNNLLNSEYEVLKNNLQIAYTQFKMNLIEYNSL